MYMCLHIQETSKHTRTLIANGWVTCNGQVDCQEGVLGLLFNGLGLQLGRTVFVLLLVIPDKAKLM